MNDLHDRIEVTNDSVGPHGRAFASPAPDAESAHLGQQLLRQSIQEMERLRQEYQQVYALIDRLWQQLAQREAKLGQQLTDAMALLSDAERCAEDEARDEGQRPLLFLHAQTLGRFALSYQGKPIALGSSRKGQAVLRYLITRLDRRSGSYVLLDLFWPGEPPERSKHKLHIAVSKLRLTIHHALLSLLPEPVPSSTVQTLESCILFEDDCYCIHPAIQIEVDADSFTSHFEAGEHLYRSQQRQAAIQDYRAAVDLYLGDFMTDDLYADWAIGPRARLEEIYLTLLGHLADDHFVQKEYAKAIACCRQILERDSFREDAYRQLMRCYSRMGRRNQALREFATCTQVLQQELGVPPMHETLELYERIANEENV